MKIALFGAETTVGKLVLKQCIYKSIAVNVLSLNELFLDLPEDAQVTTMHGSLFDETIVRKTISGCEAIIFTPATSDPQGNLTRSLGTKKILQAMEQEKINRIVCLAGYTICTSPNGNLWKEQSDYEGEDGLMEEEYVRMLEQLKNSNTDYTIICAHNIIEIAPTGMYKLAAIIEEIPTDDTNGNDVAMAIINAVTRKDHVQEVVGFV